MIGRLEMWIDGVARDGPENMAVDEWLLRTAEKPLLRIYRWLPGWGSFGYFVKEADARAALPGVRLVRRWTGGGIVDHRADWTYTLVLPADEPLAVARGGEAYRVIHGALAAALGSGGTGASLAGEAAPVRGGECFRQPAEHDLLNPAGVKIAGAGQRRTREGLLHQGSLAAGGGPALAGRLAANLARVVDSVGLRPDRAEIETLIRTRYCSNPWTARR